VKDAGGQKLGYFYYEEEAGRRSAAKLLSKDEATRIAANFAKLPQLLKKPREKSKTKQPGYSGIPAMNAAAKCSICVAITSAIVMSIAPCEALASGAMHLSGWYLSRAEASSRTVTSSRTETTPLAILGGCGGKRYRDPNTHRCRGPGDLGD
jgi:hypothetical protein